MITTEWYVTLGDNIQTLTQWVSRSLGQCVTGSLGHVSGENGFTEAVISDSVEAVRTT